MTTETILVASLVINLVVIIGSYVLVSRVNHRSIEQNKDLTSQLVALNNPGAAILTAQMRAAQAKEALGLELDPDHGKEGHLDYQEALLEDARTGGGAAASALAHSIPR
jgi:hypothetical protein